MGGEGERGVGGENCVGVVRDWDERSSALGFGEGSNEICSGEGDF
jgi:hypothetical protein